MKIKTYLAAALLGAVAVGTVSCNEFLDRKPYNVNPELYFMSESDVFAYAINRYGAFPTSGDYNVGAMAMIDHGTDNQMGQNSMGTRWIPGEWKVGSGGGSWEWGNLYTMNYFLRNALPKYEAGKIAGDPKEIKHAIGEVYFFRAYFYFTRLMQLGDLPIVYQVLPDIKDPLLMASRRQPRHKVARMILADLDSAYNYMYATPKGGKNRLTPLAVKLFRSRVALYEGTFEKNFAGTAFVPGGPGWPGTNAQGYDNTTEVSYFLGEAMTAAKEVADAVALATNPADYNYTKNDGSGVSSDYFEMFGTINQGLHDAKFAEVLLYRAYNFGVQLGHFNGSYLINGGATGYTNQFMTAFVMRNGLPVYAAGSGYLGDDSVNMMKIGRDSRFQVFVKGPGDVLNDGAKNKEPYKTPLFDIESQRAMTGYMVKKGVSRDPSQTETGTYGTTGSIIFRAVEAYLNYVEACYEKNGSLDADATKYWQAVRSRANIEPDFNVTIGATDMAKEAATDLGAFSKGVVIDATRYNIRRERRCEFIAEGMRMNDLIRWRALDQLTEGNRFMPLGFNFWTAMYQRYTPYAVELDKEGKPIVPKPGEEEVREPTLTEAGSVSAKADPFAQGKYLVPLRLSISSNNLYAKGIFWHPAHYLNPIASSHFLDATATPADGGSANPEQSEIYQNPGWSKLANTTPIAVGGF